MICQTSQKPKRICQKGNDIKSRIFFSCLLPLILIITWEVSAVFYEQPWILPRASSVFMLLLDPMKEHLASGSLFSNTVISLFRVVIGFLLAALIAIPSGIILGTSRILRNIFEPVIELIRPLCPIALMPFVIAVFGITSLSQVFGFKYSGTIFDQLQIGMLFILFWGAFFPILINTIDGVSGVRESYIKLGKMLGANNKQLLLKVYLPAALPMILTGLRQGGGVCWFVIIASEMLPGGDSGIGYFLIYAADLSEMRIVIACMIIIGAIGALFNLITVILMKRFVSWYGREAG